MRHSHQVYLRKALNLIGTRELLRYPPVPGCVTLELGRRGQEEHRTTSRVTRNKRPRITKGINVKCSATMRLRPNFQKSRFNTYKHLPTWKRTVHTTSRYETTSALSGVSADDSFANGYCRSFFSPRLALSLRAMASRSLCPRWASQRGTLPWIWSPRPVTQQPSLGPRTECSSLEVSSAVSFQHTQSRS